MSTTIATGDGYTVESTHESASDMLEALTPQEENDQPRVLRDKGKDVEPEETDPLSKAAAELGKKGGKAAAEARKAKPIPDKPKEEAKPEEKPEEKPEAKAAAEDDEDEDEDVPLTDKQRRRIEKATKQAAEAKRQARESELRYQREIGETRARLEMLERSRQPQEHAQDRPRPQAPVTRPRPEPSDFESYDGEGGYVDALTDWKLEQRDARAAQQQHMRALNDGVKAAERQFGGHIKAAFATKDAFIAGVSDEVRAMVPSYRLGRDDPWGPDNVIADEFMRAGDKVGPIMRYLSENPNELQRLRALRTPDDLKLEMRILARTIGPRGDATAGTPPAAQGSGSKPETSKAKPPVPPVTGSPHTSDGPSDDDSYDEHVRKANALDRRSGRR